MNDKPDYYGFWADGRNQNSIFFMHIDKSNENNIEGKILDKFGEARFSGTLALDKIVFHKLYDSFAHRRGATRNPINYQALKFAEDAYEGDYKISNEEITGIFMIQKFPDSETLHLVHEKLKDDIFEGIRRMSM